MKIMMVTPVPPARQASGSSAVLFHAQIMRLMHRHEVHLITVAGPDPLEVDAVDALMASGAHVHAWMRSQPSGVDCWLRRWRLVSLWLSRPYPFRTVWFWEPRIQQLIDQVVSEQVPDVILVEDNAMGVYRYPRSIPTVLTEHEARRPRPAAWASSSHGSRVRWALREWDWRRWARYQPMVWRRFPRLQVFTERDAEIMLSLAPDLAGRVSVNPLGVDVPDSPAEGEEPGALVFPANFSHPPNVDAALWLGHEIMPLLRGISTGVRLFLVGSYPPVEVLDLACDDIVVTGRVPEIEPYLQRASVVMAPVRTGGGMRVKVLQGMALGKPVVTTPRGAQGLELWQKELPILVGRDAQEIANLTAWLLTSADRRSDLGNRAHAFAVRYLSVDAYLNRLEDLWEQMRQGWGAV